jgi:NTE family protein
MSTDTKRVDLVLEGGGMKGIGHLGALEVLAERGYEPQNLAGTSGGAVLATLLAAGYSPPEMYDLMGSLDFKRFMDETSEGGVPLVGKPLSVILEEGVFKGDEFLDWMRDLLANKGKHRFRDLIHPEFENEPRYRYRVRVIASDITGHRLLILPQDACLFGEDPDELEIAKAVRMSMSIPLVFEPVHWKDEQGEDHLIVDGGLLSNFPVWLFDSAGVPPWPTFGLLLVEPEPREDLGHRLGPPPEGRVGIVKYGRDLLHTMLEAHDRMYVETANYARTISIPTLGVRTTEFKLTRQRAEALRRSGRDAATKFLDKWDFPGYIALFRSGKEYSRHALIAERITRAGGASTPGHD